MILSCLRCLCCTLYIYFYSLLMNAGLYLTILQADADAATDINDFPKLYTRIQQVELSGSGSGPGPDGEDKSLGMAVGSR